MQQWELVMLKDGLLRCDRVLVMTDCGPTLYYLYDSVHGWYGEREPFYYIPNPVSLPQ